MDWPDSSSHWHTPQETGEEREFYQGTVENNFQKGDVITIHFIEENQPIYQEHQINNFDFGPYEYDDSIQKAYYKNLKVIVVPRGQQNTPYIKKQ